MRRLTPHLCSLPSANQFFDTLTAGRSFPPGLFAAGRAAGLGAVEAERFPGPFFPKFIKNS